MRGLKTMKTKNWMLWGLLGWQGMATAMVTLPSQITAVTVHPGLATVTRTVAVSLPAGDEVIAIEGLPANLDEASLQVRRHSGQLQITSVEIQRRLQAASSQQAVATLETRRDTLQDELAQLTGRQQALATQESYLQALATAPGKVSTQPLAASTEWERGLNLLGDGMQRIGAQKVSLAQQQRQLNRELELVNRELERLQQDRHESRQLLIHAQADGAPSQLEIRYQVAGASWQPVYEAALDTRRNTLSLTRAALVQQATGEVWPEVALTLATSRPHQNAAPPELASWWVALRDESLIQAKSLATDRASGAVQELMAAPAPAPQANDAANLLPTLEAGDFIAEYRLSGRLTIASNQDPQRVVLGSGSQPVSPRLESVPRLDPAAYLLVDMQNTLPAPLLAGSWRLTRDGAYIGERALPLVAAGATQALAFGVDDAVRVSATQLEDRQGEQGVLTKEQTLTRRWRFVFHNGHDQAWPLQVFDSWPVSRNQQVQVEALEGLPLPQAESVPGVKRWNLTLKPQQETTLESGYQVRYPYQRHVDGL